MRFPGSMVIASLIVLFYCLACLGAGLAIFRLLRIDTDSGGHSPMTGLAAAFLLGQAVVANIWLLSALNRLFGMPCILSISSIASVGGILLLLRRLGPLRSQLRRRLSEVRSLSRPFQALAALAAAGMILHVYPAYAVHPTLDADGYYLLYSKIIAASERLAPLHCWPLPSQMCLLTELHFAALFSLSGIGAAKLFMWPVALSIAVVLFSLSGLCGLRIHGRLVTLIILLTSTAFIFLISDGKTDLTAAALGLSAFYLLAASARPVPVSVLMLTGLLTGFSITAKNTYFLCFMPPMAALVFGTLAAKPENRPSAGGRYIVAGMAAFFLFMLAAMLPNMVKNFSLFHEPFAPFYYLSGERKTFLDQVWLAPDITRRILLIYPFSLCFGVYTGQYGNLSPLWVAFLPLAALLKSAGRFFRSKPILIQSVLCGLSGIALWNFFFPSYHAPRYFLADLLLLMPSAGCAAGVLLENRQTPRLIRAAIIFCLAVSVGFVLFSQTRLVLKGQVGGLDWGAPVAGTEGLHDRAFMKANRLIPAGSRLFLHGGHTVYLRGDLLQGISTREEQEEHSGLRHSKIRWSYLFNRGFSYVAIRGNPYIRNPETDRLFDASDKPEWLTIREILNQNGLRLLHLRAKDSRHRSALALRQIHPPAWDVVKTGL